MYIHEESTCGTHCIATELPLTGQRRRPVPSGVSSPCPRLLGLRGTARGETEANAIFLPTWDSVVNTNRWITHCGFIQLLRCWEYEIKKTPHLALPWHCGILLNRVSVSWSAALTTGNGESTLHHPLPIESKEGLLIDFYFCFWTNRELWTWHQM